MSQPLLIATIISALCLVLAWGVIPWALRRRGVYMKRHTKFGTALVFDSADDDGTAVRLLNVAGTFQSVSYIDEDLRWELVCVYHRHFAEVLGSAGMPRRALVMGGGGYSFPKWLVAHDERVQVEAVEIDPKITELARRFFFLDEFEDAFPDGRLCLVEGDAWGYLQCQEEAYDLVVNDAFSGKRPLGPMRTAEGARIIHEHLVPGGIYFANVISRLDEGHRGVLDETLATFAQEFAHVWYVPERKEEPGRAGNNAMIACDRDLDLSRIPDAVRVS